MTIFYVQAEAECDRCHRRFLGASLRLSDDDGEEISRIPCTLTSSVQVERLPHGFKNMAGGIVGDNWQPGGNWCAECVERATIAVADEAAKAVERKAKRQARKAKP